MEKKNPSSFAHALWILSRERIDDTRTRTPWSWRNCRDQMNIKQHWHSVMCCHKKYIKVDIDSIYMRWNINPMWNGQTGISTFFLEFHLSWRKCSPCHVTAQLHITVLHWHNVVFFFLTMPNTVFFLHKALGTNTMKVWRFFYTKIQLQIELKPTPML